MAFYIQGAAEVDAPESFFISCLGEWTPDKELALSFTSMYQARDYFLRASRLTRLPYVWVLGPKGGKHYIRERKIRHAQNYGMYSQHGKTRTH
jgi:hypothetical protein